MTRKPPPVGTVIDLRWEDGAEEWYVRGHVSDDVALEAVRAVLQDEVEDGDRESVPRLEVSRRTWGRKVPDFGDRFAYRFLAGYGPGPGASPVTEVIDADARDRETAYKAEINQGWQDAEDMIRGRYPEATEVSVPRYPVLESSIRFQLPGLAGWVGYDRKDPEHVTVHPADVDAWNRLYRGRAS